MKLGRITNIILIISFCVQCTAQDKSKNSDLITEGEVLSLPEKLPVKVGAEIVDAYLPLIKGKNVGVVANHTSLIYKTHLVDSLLSLGINIVTVFSPEHGFRGNADAGEKVTSEVDSKTNLPIVSLYGKNKKPTAEQLKGIDIILFDIQDVGARFYTYISTMHYVMEACAENNIAFVVLDRPNPNGHYVDGPILEEKFQSFVGLHPVPIVHGMTVGEYAQMINGEGWLKDSVTCNLTVIATENYDHTVFYDLPIKPSPNLPNMSSIYLYPSICLFEGTPISVGRGTDTPFQVLGHPDIKSKDYSFTPKSMPGAKNPKLKGEKCYGYDLSERGGVDMKEKRRLHLSWLLEIYKEFPDKDHFFSDFFNLLAGTHELQEQIKAGKTEEQIRASWKKGLESFKKVRKKYLIYQDFE